jgi:hypothetical protein
LGVPVAAAILGGLAAAYGSASPRDAHATVISRNCPAEQTSPSYARRVTNALSARKDVWGNALLARPEGPTYAGAAQYLQPLLFARGARGARLTRSGVYYLPFALPAGDRGAGSVALHVADGSQIVSQRVGGSSLDVLVGEHGRELYGSCLARLTPAHLVDGYLPILQTHYVDARGVRYRQESFAGRLAGTGSLVSWVRITADARSAASAASIRLALSPRGLRRMAATIVRRRATYLVFSSGGRFSARSLTYRVPRGTIRTVYAAWLNTPSSARTTRLDPETYDAARRSVVRYWRERLTEGMSITVPERRVENAERALLIQDLVLTWRYSIGNAYEEFSFPEGVDVAEVLGEHGFGAVARSILTTSLTRSSEPYANWKRGERLLASASHYRLFRDRSYIGAATPVLRGFVSALGRQLPGPGAAMLERERFSSDIPDLVYGFHSQAMAWQGLRAMASVWARTGQPALAATSRRLAARLEPGLRRALHTSERRLPDGSLFVPARLLDREQPYDSVTEARSGSYWNLVVPYALASGFIPPGSAEAQGAMRYMLLHGSRLLGLVRAGAYALYGRAVEFPISGTDEVYGVNVARFLADNDQADQLVLSLYGELAAAMTPNTFVSGEGASVAPLHGERYRSMYLPPNGASNAAFLETLRLMLVHETLDRDGNPYGLQLAYATPRAWLRPGKRIAVRDAPTSFGPVSYSIVSGKRSARVSIEVPGRTPPRMLGLRLRLPRGYRLRRMTLNGRPFSGFDAATGTIHLSGRTGSLDLKVETGPK